MIKQIGTQIGNLPIAIRDGYTFIGWYIQKIGGVKISESTYVGGNITYYAQWIANTDTKYVVKHWQQNIDGNADIKNDVNYTLKDTETLEGTTDEIVIPGIKKYTGFTSPDVRKISILGDGSLVVDYYYKRNKYNVVLDMASIVEDINELSKLKKKIVFYNRLTDEDFEVTLDDSVDILTDTSIKLLKEGKSKTLKFQ